MPFVNIDLHVLKKIALNNKEIETNARRMTSLFMKNEELYGENKGLLEFIENRVKEEGQKDGMDN